MYCCILLLLCFVGYCLLALYWVVSLMETFITKFVLVPLFTTVLVTDFSSALSPQPPSDGCCWLQVGVQIGSP